MHESRIFNVIEAVISTIVRRQVVAVSSHSAMCVNLRSGTWYCCLAPSYTTQCLLHRTFLMWPLSS